MKIIVFSCLNQLNKRFDVDDGTNRPKSDQNIERKKKPRKGQRTCVEERRFNNFQINGIMTTFKKKFLTNFIIVLKCSSSEKSSIFIRFNASYRNFLNSHRRSINTFDDKYHFIVKNLTKIFTRQI